MKALDEPAKKIAQNAGKEGSVIVDKLKQHYAESTKDKDLSWGYNASSDEFMDMVQAGIVDPTKVARSALHNAASIAALLLTTEATVTEIPEKDKAPAMPPGGMGGMGPEMY